MEQISPCWGYMLRHVFVVFRSPVYYFYIYLCFDFGTPTPITIGCHGGHGLTASINLSEPPLSILIMLIAFMLLGCIKFSSMNSLHMFSQRTGVCVPFGASRSFANIRFLEKEKLLNFPQHLHGKTTHILIIFAFVQTLRGTQQ